MGCNAFVWHAYVARSSLIRAAVLNGAGRWGLRSSSLTSQARRVNRMIENACNMVFTMIFIDIRLRLDLLGVQRQTFGFVGCAESTTLEPPRRLKVIPFADRTLLYIWIMLVFDFCCRTGNVDNIIRYV